MHIHASRNSRKGMSNGIKDDWAAQDKVKTQHIAHFLKYSNTAPHVPITLKPLILLLRGRIEKETSRKVKYW